MSKTEERGSISVYVDRAAVHCFTFSLQLKKIKIKKKAGKFFRPCRTWSKEGNSEKCYWNFSLYLGDIILAVDLPCTGYESESRSSAGKQHIKHPGSSLLRVFVSTDLHFASMFVAVMGV